ncbi:MAG TPA: FG-GAP-like repeat-containing protein, partial [Phycisphaerales bacterium]|nr:FG-GAP-like repeat-containing protein [Phycisphaerales bacterium]
MHRFACALAAMAGAASTASATWSIVLIDTRTGEIALGSATCLTNFDLRAGTPVLIPGVGGATAQSFVDQGGYNRVFIRDRLLEGVAPEEILTLLESFDNGHDTRQYGMGDVHGRVATFTGDRAGEWAGGVTGRVGDVVYAVQGNVLAGEPVVAETAQVIVESLGAGLDLPETMMLAMEEAHLYGGDGRCSCSNNDADGCGSPPDGWDPETGKSAHIAYMLIARDGDGFGCNSVYRTGRAPMGVAAGDFNGDGLIDLAAAARNDSVIDIMLNTALHEGYVSLDPARSADAPGQPTGVAAADFDRDGRLDLVYADAQSDKVGLLYGAGDGTFSFPALMAAQAGTSWVAQADFNADGWPDAAATNLDAGTVTILLNDGAGRLDAAQHAPAGIAPGVIVAAEIDGAAGVDLACIDQGGPAVAVLANDGSGSFSLWRTLATDARPMSVAAGDFDGDGRADLASANRDGRNVRVFRQTSPGSFETASIGASQQYVAIEALDVNADGLQDLAASHDGSAGFTVLLGRAGTDPAPDRTYALVNSTNDLAAADFTGDGLADLATNARAANGIMAVAGVDPDRGDGFFNNGYGCASAPYYMEFNVAFQKVTDP